MQLETSVTVRALLAQMTNLALDGPSGDLRRHRESVRDISEVIATQVRTPLLPTLESPSVKWIGNLMVVT